MSLKTIFIDQSDTISGAAAKATVASTGTAWALSDLDGAQVAGWLTAFYVALQIFLLLPKIRERITSYWRAWFK